MEQRGGAAHDFEARGRGRIDRHAVIGRLAGEVVDALAVLEQQHAIAVEAANHGTRRPGPERSLRHARLILRAPRRASPPSLDAEVLPGEHRGRLIRLERVARVRAHRQHFRVVQLRLQLHVRPASGVCAPCAGTVASTRVGPKPCAVILR